MLGDFSNMWMAPKESLYVQSSPGWFEEGIPRERRLRILSRRPIHERRNWELGSGRLN
jgi:hypothetical protein